jgi:hypothetical protein
LISLKEARTMMSAEEKEEFAYFENLIDKAIKENAQSCVITLEVPTRPSVNVSAILCRAYIEDGGWGQLYFLRNSAESYKIQLIE